MTIIVVPIFVDAPDEVGAALARAGDAAGRGAGMIEWRIDRLAGEPEALAAARRLVAESPRPCIVTCRPVWEGGGYDGGEEDRLDLLAGLAEAGAGYLDVELAALREGGARIRGCVREEGAEDGGPTTGLILSSHDFDRRPADLLQRIEAMTIEPACSIIKVAWAARSLRDNLEAFDLLADRGKPTIALCMGEFGLMSRVLAPKFGGFLTFASGAEGAETAPGQPTLADLRERYRFDGIGPGTRVYGVIGWPIGHSVSPLYHNAAFEESGHDGVLLPMPVPTEYEHFKATVGALIDHPRLGFAGASVTIPHKEHLLRFVRERGGRIDARAERIGAANTLAVSSAGGMECLNTDAPAAVDALAAGMGAAPGDLGAARIAVFGTGGVARAVIAGLGETGASVEVFSRDPDRARALAEEMIAALKPPSGPARIAAGAPDTLARGGFDVYVNCTPVGMTGGPDPAGSPLPEDTHLDEKATVFDTVYAPLRTPLLREAEARGARVVTGLDMFVRQAALQFERWTGSPPPKGIERVLST